MRSSRTVSRPGTQAVDTGPAGSAVATEVAVTGPVMAEVESHGAAAEVESHGVAAEVEEGPLGVACTAVQPKASNMAVAKARRRAWTTMRGRVPMLCIYSHPLPLVPSRVVPGAISLLYVSSLTVQLPLRGFRWHSIDG